MAGLGDFPGLPPINPQLKPNWFIGLGVVLIVLGGIAFVDTVVTTLASVVVIGALLILTGIAYLIQSFAHRTVAGSRFWITALMGFLYALGGILLIQEPETGSLFITAFLAGCLMASGLMRGFWAAGHRYVANWWTLVLSAAVALLTGVLIFVTLPWSGLWLIGTLIAVELVFGGVSALAFGLSLKKAGR
ncbi:HdeD family acid-resistance protein [Asaia astilbis]|uniref:HdeD family acid-resistance protein n=1 Tax=Asaia astilbis TaxID=610244 RepID=UPI00046FD377|nr:HdeD family acid-resistance protein [Asaia astilbis]